MSGFNKKKVLLRLYFKVNCFGGDVVGIYCG